MRKRKSGGEGNLLNRDLIRSFPAHASALRDVRGFIRERSEEAGLPADAANDLLIATIEACTNVVRHSGAPEIRLRWRVESGRVEVEVEDEGVFVHRPPDPEREGGFGIPFMQSLMDEVVILQGDDGHPGTKVLLSKEVPVGLRPAAARSTGPRSSHLHPPGTVPARNGGRKRRTPLHARSVLAITALSVAAFAAVAVATVRAIHHPTKVALTGAQQSPAPATLGPAPSRQNHDGSGSTGQHHSSPAPAPRETSGPAPTGGTQGKPITPVQPVNLPHLACPDDPLLGVPVPAILSVKDSCRWVQGTVRSVQEVPGGGLRISLMPVDADRALVAQGHGTTLPVIVLAGQKLPRPDVGERVAALGTYVRNDVVGWFGIEPVWAIDYLDRGLVRHSIPQPASKQSPGVCVPGTSTCVNVPTSGAVSAPSLPAVP